jgi:uncharacterized caspase-like protein
MKFLLLTLLTLLPITVGFSQNKHALIISIDEYAKKGAFQQVDSVQGHWSSIENGTGLTYLQAALERHEFSQHNIRTIQNELATKANIISAINELINAIRPGDNVVFHYSGHGQKITSREKGKSKSEKLENTLVPYDAPSQFSKGEYAGEKYIRESEMQALVELLRKKLGRFGQLMITLDMNYSAINLVPQGDENPDDDIASYIILAASAQDELKNNNPHSSFNGQSMFSYALTRALANSSVNTTYEMLYTQMGYLTETLASKQHFQIQGHTASLLFNGYASPAMSNYAIKEILDDSTLLLKAGAFFGIIDGVELLITNKSDSYNSSFQTGIVIQSDEFTSTVRMASPLELRDPQKLNASIAGINSFQLGIKKVSVAQKAGVVEITKFNDTVAVGERAMLYEGDHFIFSVKIPAELTNKYSLQIWEVSEENTTPLFQLIDLKSEGVKRTEVAKGIDAIDFSLPDNVFVITPPFYSAYYLAVLTPFPALFSGEATADSKRYGDMQIETVLRKALSGAFDSDRTNILNALDMMVYTSIMRVDYLPKFSVEPIGSGRRSLTRNDLDFSAESLNLFESNFLIAKTDITICFDALDFGCADIEVLFPQSLFGATSSTGKRGATRILPPTNLKKIELRGKVYSDDSLTNLLINQREIAFEKRGRLDYNWSHQIYLEEGENTILLEALTAANNYRQETISINLEAPSQDVESVNHLLLIGINDYENWSVLKNATNDIEAVRKTLTERYQFHDSNTVVIANAEATKTTIERTLRSLARKVQPNDNVLIYYAGHGWYDSLLNEGYWVPVEGSSDLEETSTYISNVIITQYIRSINAQHVLLVADACFSGSLYAVPTRGVADQQQYLSNLAKQKSRWVLASGGLEEVADVSFQDKNLSPFAYYFVKYLTEKNEAFSALDSTAYLVQAVGNNSEQQAIGSPLRNAGDEGGQFVFKPKVDGD